eukprot:g820.t1
MLQYTDKNMRSDFSFLEETEVMSSAARRQLRQRLGTHAHRFANRHGKGNGARKGKSKGKREPSTTKGTDQDGSQSHGQKQENQKERQREEQNEHEKGDVAVLDAGRNTREEYLLAAAKKRGINYAMLPKGMQRRKENPSWWRRKDDLIFWKVDWVFHEPSEDEHARVKRPEWKKMTNCVQEDIPLHNVLRSLLEKDPVSKHRLRAIFSAPRGGETAKVLDFSDLIYRLKADGCAANAQLYHAMSQAATLRESLSGKYMIENPIIHVFSSLVDADRECPTTTRE